MKFNVYDEDGLFSLVNTDQYITFVNEDWSLSDLLIHFVAEMNKQHLLVWQTSVGGGNWIIEVLSQPSDRKSAREFSAFIKVTDGALHFVNYTDLTMAAQFEDEKLPSKHNTAWRIPIGNGMYNVTVRQLFDPAKYDYDDTESTSFEIILKPASGDNKNTINKVFWWEE